MPINDIKITQTDYGSYQYVLIDKKGIPFPIKPSELLKQKGMDPNYPTFDEHLSMDENVHMFNAMFDSNKELMDNLIALWNLDHTAINPNDYECVKLITKEMTNSYGLPMYHPCKEENKGNLLVPIIYKSDLSIAEHRSKTNDNENDYYYFDLLRPDEYTFYSRIPTKLFSSNNTFYSGECKYLHECFVKKYKAIFAIEKSYGKTAIIRDFSGRRISYDDADILEIIFNTCSEKNSQIEECIFPKYVQRGDFFYRLMLDIMIMSKRAYIVNDGKCNFGDIFVSPKITERYFIYSKDEIKKLMNQDKMNEEQLKTLTDVSMDIVESNKHIKSEEENLQDFINRINADIEGIRPTYKRRKTDEEIEEELLPFEFKKLDEKTPNDYYAPEEYYTREDYYRNEEIRNAINLASNDESSYTDYDERTDRAR